MPSNEFVRRPGGIAPSSADAHRRASFPADDPLGGDSVCRAPNPRLDAGSEETARLAAGRIDERAGDSASGLSSLPEEVEPWVGSARREMPVLDGADAQAAVTRAELNRAEISQSGWRSAWRPAWMYFLGAVWFLRLMVVPPVDAFAGTELAEAMDLSAMLSLTSWFLGLYMGGHTLKTLGEAAVEAVRVAREGRYR